MSTKELTNEKQTISVSEIAITGVCIALQQDLSISGFRLQLMADWFIWEMYHCFWQQLFLENVLVHWLVQLEWLCLI